MLCLDTTHLRTKNEKFINTDKKWWSTGQCKYQQLTGQHLASNVNKSNYSKRHFVDTHDTCIFFFLKTVNYISWPVHVRDGVLGFVTKNKNKYYWHRHGQCEYRQLTGQYLASNVNKSKSFSDNYILGFGHLWVNPNH